MIAEILRERFTPRRRRPHARTSIASPRPSPAKRSKRTAPSTKPGACTNSACRTPTRRWCGWDGRAQCALEAEAPAAASSFLPPRPPPPLSNHRRMYEVAEERTVVVALPRRLDHHYGEEIFVRSDPESRAGDAAPV